tara:strand:+ start:234 stop:851 length:618 start_codon:yes stop_codon:yes gene_type:complete
VLNNPLLPTAYLAPINYYAILIEQSNCKIEFHENFVKQSIRNRCVIYSANGELRLTVPRKHEKNSKTLISKIKISYKDRWQKEHWNAITSAYNSSPFFEFYKDELKPFFEEKEIYLINFNTKLQNLILKLLQVKVKYTFTNEYNSLGNFTDYRNCNFTNIKICRYDQVFMEKHGFIANLSILDLLFNLGPDSSDYLKAISTNQKK